MPAPCSDEVQLVRLCRAGRSQAFEPLVRRYQGAAYATALSYMGDRQDAQDAVQEAFIAAFCKLDQLRRPDRFGSWLYGIVITRCKERLRQRRSMRQRTASLEDAEDDLARKARADQAHRTLVRDLWESVDLLPEKYRTVVLLHYLSGFSYREIAEFLELPLSTVTGRLQQSRMRLREALSPEELEVVEMSKVDISENVRQSLYQIATAPVEEHIALQGKHIVLYCGLDVDVQVRQAEGDEILLEGTRVAIGPSPEAARSSVENIRVQWDMVEDFTSSGPHPGEEFTGTDWVEGKPVTRSISSAERWQHYREGTGEQIGGAHPLKLFPFMQEGDELLPAPLRADLREAVRISISRDSVEDAYLSEEQYTPDIQKVFYPNSSSSGSQHGPVGYVSLTLSIPRKSTLTLFRGREVQVQQIQASINLIEGRAVQVRDMEGDLRLLGTHLMEARQIKGSLHQRFFNYSPASWRDHQVGRDERAHCRLERVEGEIDIAVGQVDLEASELTGRVAISNRHGGTRLHQGAFRQGDRCRLESCSGSIRLSLREVPVSRMSLMVHTLCGTVHYDGLRDFDVFKQSNNLQVTALAVPSSLSWKALDDPHFYLKTESGDIAVEKV